MISVLKALAMHEKTIRRLLILTLLYLVLPVEAIQPIIVADPDIWLHLRTGQWILDHGTVPTTDRLGAGQGKNQNYGGASQ